MAESRTEQVGDGESTPDAPAATRWVAPSESPVTVVAHRLRMRYKTERTNRNPRKGLLAKVVKRKEMVSVSALRGVDLQVRSGEFVGIIGRNGSGKSTLLRVLAGVEPPTSGVVMTSARPQLLGVGAALIPELTGADNIKLGFLAMGLSAEEAEEKFPAAAELSALGETIDLPMRTYSSGMGARLKFAISVMAEPKILMIDEALSTGDATFSERSAKKMDDMLADAGTVFMVNHAAQTIENMCSRAIWMERGRVVLDGDAVDVARKYRWFAHNLAQGDEEKAAGLLREAILEGESVRNASMLTLPDETEVPEPQDGAPEIEQDPFLAVFTKDMKAQRFPGTVFPAGSDGSADNRRQSD
ncbi:ABC transporter ATP-binding protein [Brachybacterium tyrofermentans]|uniref:ABC transporter ATP-binding protein n=1 Tax=Brachybacterium tyrofermentans TaxID=47848 RepID=UPI003FD51F39